MSQSTKSTKTVLRLSLFIIILLLTSATVLAATKPIAGYIFKTDGTTVAPNASVRVYVNQASVSAANPCYTNPAVLSGVDGSWSTNLANLKRADNGNDCSGFWATGDAIWANAIGQNVTPEHGNLSTANTTIASGTGLQYLSNVSLPAGPDRIAPVIRLIAPPNATNNTNGSILFQYNVTDDSLISNCSVLFNGTINTTNTSITRNITMNFSLTNIADGHYNWSVGCYDNVTNYNTSIETWFLNVSKVGHYNLSLVTPTSNTSVEQNQFFTFTMQVKCYDGSCGDTNASLDPIILGEDQTIVSQNKFHSQGFFEKIWSYFAEFFSGNLITGQVTGALVPMVPTTPFYTNMSNPMNLSNVSCLANMAQNSACNVTWYVNASGPVGTVAEFWAFTNSTIYTALNNETPHLFISIVESIPPAIINYTPRGETFNVTQLIEISLNTTDPQNISFVKANITYPNATVDLINLTRVGTTDKYNSSYTIPPRTGFYLIKFWVNDTGNNINGTTQTNFTGQDIVPPNVTTLLPAISTSYNTSQIIQISLNATDVTNISTTFATITSPNSTKTNVTLSRQGTTYKYNGTYTVPPRIGTFNITFFANDSKNNINNSEVSNFTVLDGEYPRLATIVEAPTDPATYVYNQTYFFNITITDNIGINNVIMQFNNTNYTAEIKNQSTIFQFNISDLAAATYNYVWYANDTSGYINSTSSTYTISKASSTVNLTLYGNDSNTNISVNTPVNLSGVRIAGDGQIELLQNGSVLSLGNTSTSSNQTYTTLTSYNISIRHNSTQNFTASQEDHVLAIKDYISPNVTLVTVNASSVNQTQHVRINATIIDNLQIDSIKTQIWFPNGSVQNFTMNNISSSFNTTYITILTSNIGNHTAQILANDTSGNRNTTQNVSFWVYDITPPAVTLLIPANQTTLGNGTTIQLSSTTTDNIAISSTYANITYPNNSIQSIPLTLTTASKYNSSLLLGQQTGIYLMQIFSNDSSNNINATEQVLFYVNETDGPPNVTLVAVNVSSVNQTQHVRINATVMDAISVDTVKTQIYFPNGSIQNFTMSNVSSYYNTTYITILTSNIGNHTAQIIANDTNGNRNTTQNVTFWVYDITPPNVTALIPTNQSTVFTGTSIQIAANVTDNTALSTVYANITYPNSSITSLPLSLATGAKYNSTLTLGSYNGTYTLLIFSNDSSNNINATEQTQFFVNTSDNAPVVTLLNPADSYTNTTSTYLEMNFSCSATDDYALRNISLYLSNPSNTNFSQNQSTLLNGTTNSTSWLLNLTQGSFTWNCQAIDNSTQLDWASNRSITLSAPSSSSSSSSSSGGGGGSSSSTSSSSGGPIPQKRVDVNATPTCLWNESIIAGNCMYNESNVLLNASPTEIPINSNQGIFNLVGRAFDINIHAFGLDLSLLYIALMVFLLGLLVLLLTRRKRPYLIIQAPTMAAPGDTFDVNVKLGNDYRPVVLRIWSIFVPEGEVGLLNIKNIIGKGPTYRLEVDRSEIRRGTIPVAIPAQFMPGKYRIITCVRWEYKKTNEPKSLVEKGTTQEKIKITAHQNKITVTQTKLPIPPALLVLVGKRSRLPENIAINLQTMREKLAPTANIVELARTREEIVLRMHQAEKMHNLRLKKLEIEEDMRHTEEEGVLQLQLTRLNSTLTKNAAPVQRSTQTPTKRDRK